MTPDWSILIATVPSRIRTCYPDLLDVLQAQIGDRPIEVLGLYDNKRRSVGAKRNALLSLANGYYVSFIDDDDLIAEDFIDRIHRAIDAQFGDIEHTPVDVMVYDQWCSEDGAPPYRCKYGIHLEYARSTTLWTGKPAHNMIWRHELVADLRFPNYNVGEDVDWCMAASSRAKTELRLDGEPLYFYNCRTDRSETRAEGLQRDVPAAYREWWRAAVGRGPNA
jgi:hypothetical protein